MEARSTPALSCEERQSGGSSANSIGAVDQMLFRGLSLLSLKADLHARVPARRLFSLDQGWFPKRSRQRKWGHGVCQAEPHAEQDFVEAESGWRGKGLDGRREGARPSPTERGRAGTGNEHDRAGGASPSPTTPTGEKGGGTRKEGGRSGRLRLTRNLSPP